MIIVLGNESGDESENEELKNWKNHHSQEKCFNAAGRIGLISRNIVGKG